MEKNIHQDLSDALDEELLNRVKSKEATAAELNVARQRLRDMGMTKVVPEDDPLRHLADELGVKETNLIKLPPLDDEDDIATRSTG